MANSLIVGGLTVGMNVAIACPNAYLVFKLPSDKVTDSRLQN